MAFGLPPALAEWLKLDWVTEMAERVAGRSRLGVWQRVMSQLPDLGPHEARGYLRARAASVIRSETERLIEQEGTWVARLRGPIEDAAVQLLVQSMITHLQHRSSAISGRSRSWARRALPPLPSSIRVWA